MKKALLIYILFILGCAQLLANEKTDSSTVDLNRFIYNPDHFAFTDLRYGYSRLGHHFHTGFNYKYRFNIFKIGFTHTNNFSKTDSASNKFNEIGALYGWSFRKKNFLFSASFGISGNWGNATTNQKTLDTVPIYFNPQINIKTVGFPIEITFAFTPPPKIKTFSSIGLVLFGNFNNQKSYVGAGLNIAIGKVSPKTPPHLVNNPLKDYYVPKQRRQKWYD